MHEIVQTTVKFSGADLSKGPPSQKLQHLVLCGVGVEHFMLDQLVVAICRGGALRGRCRTPSSSFAVCRRCWSCCRRGRTITITLALTRLALQNKNITLVKNNTLTLTGEETAQTRGNQPEMYLCTVKARCLVLESLMCLHHQNGTSEGATWPQAPSNELITCTMYVSVWVIQQPLSFIGV